MTLAALAIAVTVLILVAGMSRSFQNDVTRQLIADGPQTVAELAEALGMEPAPSRSRSFLTFEGEVAGARARLLINCDMEGRQNASSWRLGSVTLEVFGVTTGAFTFSSIWAAPSAEASSDSPLSDLTRGHVYEGSRGDALVFFGPDVTRALNALWERRPDPIGGVGVFLSTWHGVRISESIKVHGLEVSPLSDRMCHLVRDWPMLVGGVEDLLSAWSHQADAPTRLLLHVRRDGGSLEQRWHAARALLSDHAESEAAEAMRAGAGGLPEWVGLLCAVSPVARDAAYAPLSKALEAEAELMRLYFAERLGARFPWEVFVDANCPAGLRDELFEAAMAAAPNDQMDALAQMLTGDLDATEHRGALYKRLLDAGWEPSPEARALLARGGVASIRHALIRELHDREVTAADAPTLAALMESGHEGDAAPLLRALEERGELHAGGLSVSEDPVALGGLSRATEGGGLTAERYEREEDA